MNGSLNFRFGAVSSSAHIVPELPSIGHIAGRFSPAGSFFRALLVCDENTRPLAEKIREKGGLSAGPAAGGIPVCVLRPGESAKNWAAVETILRAAAESGLGRDGLFIGIGGGVVGDLTALAASIYMRGCRLCLVATTLLAMVDASLGGKTGFDLFGIKNLAGTFYPARHVYMPLESLNTLPPAEWKSGMAELIKTAVLAGGDFPALLESLREGGISAPPAPDFSQNGLCTILGAPQETLSRAIYRAAAFKGRVVAADPRETGGRRRLLNLGHTFGHALESAAGLGNISHGEAVAWGMARACDLGRALGITTPERAGQIMALLRGFGYETAAPHPLMDTAAFLRALGRDKKSSDGKLVFIVPDSRGARAAAVEGDSLPAQIIQGSGGF